MCEFDKMATENGSHLQEEVEDEPLDPRIQHLLDLMNNSAVLVNKFENDLGLAHQKLRLMYADCVERLNKEASRIGSRIHKAAAYYENGLKVKEAQEAVHIALIKYERAVSMESAAREMVETTEKGYEAKKRGPGLRNTAWPETLNHATNKLLESEEETVKCEGALLRANAVLANSQLDLRMQYKRNKRSISKSKLYYEMKSQFHLLLETQKETIARIEEDRSTAKSYYSSSMAKLEAISNEIHNKRLASKGSSHPVASDLNHNSTGSAHLSDKECNVIGKERSQLPTYHARSVTTSGSLPPSPPPSPVMELNGVSSCLSSSSSTLYSDDESLLSSSPSVVRRSASFASISHVADSSQQYCKPRSMSAPMAPTSININASFNDLSDNSLSASYRSIIDDISIDAAASNVYFDCDDPQRPATLPAVQSQRSSGDDYDTLPSNLASYQKEYTLRRNSVRVPKEGMDRKEISRIFSLLRVEKAEH